MGAGEFFAGLLTGASQSYTEAAHEARRIKLLKDQMAMQNAQFQQQIALTRENQTRQAAIEERQLALQEKLGFGRLGLETENVRGNLALGRDELAAKRESSWLNQIQNDRELQARLKIAADQNNLAKVLQDERQKFEAQQGDVAFGRQKELMGMDEAQKKRLATYQAGIEKDLIGVKTDAERKARREALTDEAIQKLAFHAIERSEVSADETRQLANNIRQLAAQAEANQAGSGARVIAYLKELGDELDESKATGQMSEAMIRGLRLITSDPKDAAIELGSMLGADFGNVGKAGTPEGKKISMTRGETKPGAAASTPDVSLDLKNRDEVKGFVEKNTWLKDALDAEYAKVGEGASPVARMSIRAIHNKYDFLVDQIEKAPGNTMQEKIHNAVLSWRTYKQARQAPIKPPGSS